jgi:predicted kinase
VSELIVVTGPPGAGKSTVAQILVALFEPSALVKGDDFFVMIDRGYLSPWTEEAHHQNQIVVAAAAAAAGRLVNGGYTVVYDGLIGPRFLAEFRAATALEQIRCVLLLPPEETCLDRVRLRPDHGFTDLRASGRMYREFVDAQVDPQFVVTTVGPPETIASEIFDQLREGGFMWPVERST